MAANVVAKTGAMVAASALARRDRAARRRAGGRSARHRAATTLGAGARAAYDAVRAACADARRRPAARPRHRERSSAASSARRACAGRPARAMKWLLNNWDQVLVALGEHIVDLVRRRSRSRSRCRWRSASGRRAATACFRWSLAVSGFLYTIPTLAFLALLIPIVGLGKTNAIICMVAFSLMIMIRNVATGIREVPRRRRRRRARHGHERAARS